jgi:aminoglycoside phosphotransferase (APT) family kinase protein
MALEDVLRIGNTVRRPMHPWSRSVGAVLRHIEAAGMDGAPRDLGVDVEGRHVLSWIAGDVYQAPWPVDVRSDGALIALARMLRCLHEATASFPAHPLRWITGETMGRLPGQVIVHGDIAMSNVVWRGSRPIALIDWEFAEPGPAYCDVLYGVMNLGPFFDDATCSNLGFETSPDHRRNRAARFIEAYGSPGTYDFPSQLSVDRVLHDLLDLLDRDRDRLLTLGRDRCLEPWRSFFVRGDIEANRRIHAFIRGLV